MESLGLLQDNGPVVAGQVWMIGGKQLGFSDYALTTAKLQIKQENFLSEVEAVVPWHALIALTETAFAFTRKRQGHSRLHRLGLLSLQASAPF